MNPEEIYQQFLNMPKEEQDAVREKTKGRQPSRIQRQIKEGQQFDLAGMRLVVEKISERTVLLADPEIEKQSRSRKTDDPPETEPTHPGVV